MTTIVLDDEQPDKERSGYKSGYGRCVADQFAIQTVEPLDFASPSLLSVLHMEEVDSVEIDGMHLMIVEALDVGYVEAYIFAQKIRANALFRLEANWTGVGLTSLPMEARAPFLKKTECNICAS